MAITKTIFISLLLAICISAAGQEPEQQLDAFAGRFIIALRHQTKARAILVTDKQVYSPGESIWFKATLIDPNTLQLDTRTHFLFVDLVNDKDSVLAIAIMDVQARQLSARLILHDSIHSGYYWLRAYTRKMAESDPGSISIKPVLILGKDQVPAIALPKERAPGDSILLSFYPEGGYLIPGENSIVGLRTTDGNGKPVSIDGNIKDNRDSILTNFSTNALGLGKFEINPSGYRRYRAIVNKQGKVKDYPLPAFNFRQGQVSVSKATGGYRLRVLLGDSIFTKDAITYMLAVSKDSLIFASIGNGQYETTVEEAQFPGGICTFYLFDKNFRLLSQRSIYEPEKTNVQLSTDKPVYSRREKVTLSLGITDAAQAPVAALVSISVADSGLQLRESCNVPGIPIDLDNILLAKNTCIPPSDIELLMLLKSMHDPSATTVTDSNHTDMDSLFFIKGRIVSDNGEVPAQTSVTLRSNTGKVLVEPYLTGPTGYFRFPVESYADSTQFVIHVESGNAKANKNRITLEPHAYPQLITPLWMKESLKASLIQDKRLVPIGEDSLQHSNDKQLLSKVTVRSRRKPGNYDESKRYTNSSVIITSDVINERTMVGNAVLNTGGILMLNGYLVMDGPTTDKNPDKNSEPLILVNGVEVMVPEDMPGKSPALSYLNSILPQDVDFVEILRGPQAASFGMRGGNGVILVNMVATRKGQEPEALNLKIFYGKGVANPAPFPSVSYEPKTSKTRQVADNRSTLYWNSELLTGITPTKSLTFFTSDRPGTYLAIVKGVGSHREIIYKTFAFQVK